MTFRALASGVCGGAAGVAAIPPRAPTWRGVVGRVELDVNWHTARQQSGWLLAVCGRSHRPRHSSRGSAPPVGVAGLLPLFAVIHF